MRMNREDKRKIQADQERWEYKEWGTNWGTE